MIAASSALLPALCVHIVSSPPAPPELELPPLVQAAMERGSAAASRPTATRLVVGVSFIGSSVVGRSASVLKPFSTEGSAPVQRCTRALLKPFHQRVCRLGLLTVGYAVRGCPGRGALGIRDLAV